MRGFGSLFSLASLLALATASNVLDLTPENFDKEVLKSGKPALVEFFAVSPPPPPSLPWVLVLTVFGSRGVDVSFVYSGEVASGEK